MAVKSVCGVILVTERVDALAAFYAQGLGLAFEREDHGGLDVHYGVDLGQLHFAIHPPTNFGGGPGSRGAAVAFEVERIDDHLAEIERLGGTVVTPRHDEGFGDVITLRDPEGNLFELVELRYAFDATGP